MTNLVVLSFANQANAIEASHKLADLESFGDISIFERAIIKKEPNGEITPMQIDTTEGLGIFSGMTLGTMVGVIGGPVGMLLGFLSGTLVGAIVESDHADFSDDFLANVSKRLQPGTVAILAEVSEDSQDFIDNAVTPLGAVIFRSNMDYVYDDYEDKQVKEFEDAIAAERKQLKSAMANSKAIINKKIANLKEKRRQRIAALEQKAKDQKKSRLVNSINKQEENISTLKDKLNKLEHS